MGTPLSDTDRGGETHHDVGLRKVSIVRELARPAGEVAGRVRYANVAAVLRAEVHDVGRELEHEIVGRHRSLVDLLHGLLVHIGAGVVDVAGLAELFEVGQIEAHLFLGHDRRIRMKPNGPSSIYRAR